MAKPKVRFENTPNPQAGKFTVGRTLVEGRHGRTYDSAESAEGDPVAAAVMALEGVRGVFMVADFVTVTKAPEASWGELAPRVQQAIRAAL
jgi:hypothetical protein